MVLTVTGLAGILLRPGMGAWGIYSQHQLLCATASVVGLRSAPPVQEKSHIGHLPSGHLLP